MLWVDWYGFQNLHLRVANLQDDYSCTTVTNKCFRGKSVEGNQLKTNIRNSSRTSTWSRRVFSAVRSDELQKGLVATISSYVWKGGKEEPYFMKRTPCQLWACGWIYHALGWCSQWHRKHCKDGEEWIPLNQQILGANVTLCSCKEDGVYSRLTILIHLGQSHEKRAEGFFERPSHDVNLITNL